MLEKESLKQKKKALNVLQHSGLSRKLLVRSYLMVEHQVTKISRVEARTDFTLRLVPCIYFYNKQRDMQV